ncbi:hypothetical protein K470DRAFT_260560 [Piedraia hortae CBS 480.64]|uniref:Telomere length regulation protein conserved domain-containing protein n=1 Tax=Piedraia hortae CBS 480.64 TaxID=1314780 RepID=A0A6A7BRH5_9PEZI|nr:hypothetical protein K470DRAFT_260560 [Piedraia hortae CBS 480.64]
MPEVIKTRQSEDGGLVAVSSKHKKIEKEARVSDKAAPTGEVKSTDDALQYLRSQPDQITLISVLQQLKSGTLVNLCYPGPIQVQISGALVDSIVPSFWTVQAVRDLLVDCLTNVSGINAVFRRIQQIKTDVKSNIEAQDFLNLAERFLAGKNTASALWNGISDAVSEDTKRDITWKEIATLLGSGKVVSLVAQADKRGTSWLGDGQKYALWLGENIANILQSPPQAIQLLTPALSLGYPNELLQGFYTTFTQSSTNWDSLTTFHEGLPTLSRRHFESQTLTWLSKTYTHPNEAVISSLAGLIKTFTPNHLISLLSNPTQNASLSQPVRRASIVTIPTASLPALLEKQLSTFGSSLFIAHAPMTQQESLAQSILLTASRTPKSDLTSLVRSGVHSTGVGNRLDSNVDRARWLGMLVATGLSSLVDDASNTLDFGVEEMHTHEVESYLSLTKIEDNIGSFKDFAHLIPQKITHTLPARTRVGKGEFWNGKVVFGPPRPPVQTEIIGDCVAELSPSEEDEEDEEDGDLKPYPKPHPDPKDAETDPTLINRNPPKKPVYILDLIKSLRSDDAETFSLSLSSAASLIRRKAAYGEVREHASSLLSEFMSLQNNFDTEKFEELRLDALVATVGADPEGLAPRLARMVVTGREYSTATRAGGLVALGRVGMEIAGGENPGGGFVGERLPRELESIYGLPAGYSQQKKLSSAQTEITAPSSGRGIHSAQTSLLRTPAKLPSPQHKGGDLLTPSRTRSMRPVSRPNQLSKVAYVSFLAPLLGAYSLTSSLPPYILTLLITTCSLLLNASGPGTVSLADFTSEFLTFLLSLRSKAEEGRDVCDAVLFGVLTTFEIVPDPVLRSERELVREVGEWVSNVFEKLPRDEEKMRVMAASILLRVEEVGRGV